MAVKLLFTVKGRNLEQKKVNWWWWFLFYFSFVLFLHEVLIVAVQAFYCYSAVSSRLKLIGMFDMFASLAVVIYKKVSSM